MDVWCWDWMHCYLKNGIFVVECNAYLKLLEDIGYGIHMLDRFLAAFVWPKAVKSAKDICKANDGSIRLSLNASASEYLSLAPRDVDAVVDVNDADVDDADVDVDVNDARQNEDLSCNENSCNDDTYRCRCR